MGIKGFSLNRATGLSDAKTKLAKATGIPTTKAGRKRKAERLVAQAILGTSKKGKKK